MINTAQQPYRFCKILCIDMGKYPWLNNVEKQNGTLSMHDEGQVTLELPSLQPEAELRPDHLTDLMALGRPQPNSFSINIQGGTIPLTSQGSGQI